MEEHNEKKENSKGNGKIIWGNMKKRKKSMKMLKA